MAGDAPGQQLSPQMQQFLVQENAKRELQQTVATLTHTCWDKCISTPGRDLSSREVACLENCARRYIETTQFVVKYFDSKANAGGY